MSKIDERLAEIQARADKYIFHEATDSALHQATDDLHYLLDLVEQLRQQLGTVTALVPSAEWLVMIAENGVDSTVAHELFDLADAIRAWRGDGDGSGQKKE